MQSNSRKRKRIKSDAQKIKTSPPPLSSSASLSLNMNDNYQKNNTKYELKSFNLPSVLWSKIFSFLKDKQFQMTRANIRLVSKKFRELVFPFWIQKIRLNKLHFYLSFSPTLTSTVLHLEIVTPHSLRELPKDDISVPTKFGMIFCNLAQLQTFFPIKMNDFKFLPSSLKILEFDYKFPSSSSNSEINDESFQLLPQSLIKLGFPFYSKITDKAISYLPKTLISLDLSYCDKITDEGMKFLPPSLQFLSIHRTKITDKAFKDIAKLSRLRKLCIQHSDKITGSGFQYLDFNVTICVPNLLIELTNPFFASVYFGNLESIKFFAEKMGSNIINQVDHNGKTVWDMITKQKNNTEMIRYLKSL